jgi:archaellin
MRTRMRRGLTGLDALIVFIALMIVAFVVAAALINTSGSLVNRDRTIAKEKQRGIQAPIIVEQVNGRDNDGDRRLDSIHFTLRLRAGDEPVKLNETIILVNSKVITCTSLTYMPSPEENCTFFISYGKRGPNYDDNLLNLGDMAEIAYNGSNIAKGVEDTQSHFNFIPSHGLATEIKVTIPERILQRNMGLWPLNG